MKIAFRGRFWTALTALLVPSGTLSGWFCYCEIFQNMGFSFSMVSLELLLPCYQHANTAQFNQYQKAVFAKRRPSVFWIACRRRYRVSFITSHPERRLFTERVTSQAESFHIRNSICDCESRPLFHLEKGLMFLSLPEIDSIQLAHQLIFIIRPIQYHCGVRCCCFWSK